MTELWIIRHGQASFGNSDYDKLSELGITQSRILGAYLKSLGTVFERAYAGTALRQAHTAEIVLDAMGNGSKDAGFTTEPALNEYDYKAIITDLLPALMDEDPDIAAVLPDVMKDNRAFQAMFGKIMDRWVKGYDTPSTESFRQYADRVEQGLNRLTRETDRGKVAVFTSGGVISVAMKLALKLSDAEAMRLGWWIKNTSVTVLKHRKGRLDLLSFNTLSHLERENSPELLTYR